MPGNPDILTCYHEAGHAVVAVIFEMPIKSVDVYVKGGAGHLGIYKPLKKFYKKGMEGMEDDIRSHYLLEWGNRSQHKILAGLCAQAKKEGRPADEVVIENIGDMKHISTRYSDGLLFNLTIEETMRLINEPEVWESIEKVVQYLFDFWRIEGDTLKRLVNTTIPKKRMKELRSRYTGQF